MDRRPRSGQRAFQRRAPLGEGPRREVLVAEGQQVERDETRRGLFGEQLDPAGGRMDALLQRVEVEPVPGGRRPG